MKFRILHCANLCEAGRGKAHTRNLTRQSAFDTWLPGLILFPFSPNVQRSREPRNRALIMKIERFAGHHEAAEALWLAVAGVTAIMLIESLILLILY
jgi:hypothetical protein